jgi:hypothetical protein
VALASGRLVSQFDHNMAITLGLCNKAIHLQFNVL